MTDTERFFDQLFLTWLIRSILKKSLRNIAQLYAQSMDILRKEMKVFTMDIYVYFSYVFFMVQLFSTKLSREGG